MKFKDFLLEDIGDQSKITISKKYLYAGITDLKVGELYIIDDTIELVNSKEIVFNIGIVTKDKASSECMDVCNILVEAEYGVIAHEEKQTYDTPGYHEFDIDEDSIRVKTSIFSDKTDGYPMFDEVENQFKSIKKDKLEKIATNAVSVIFTKYSDKLFNMYVAEIQEYDDNRY